LIKYIIVFYKKPINDETKNPHKYQDPTKIKKNRNGEINYVKERIATNIDIVKAN
jgi:hypothetical protein